MMNLCINARDAMPGGGVLRNQTRNVMLEEKDLGAYAPYLRANLFNHSHELMSDNIFNAHRRNVTINEVEVRPAGYRRRDSEDGIMRCQYFWIWESLHS